MVLIDLLGLNPGDSAQSIQPDPGLSSQDAEELARYSLSLKSYVIAAHSLLQQSDFSWRYKWNLNCSGVFGSDKRVIVSDIPPYSLTLSDDGKTLSVVGDIKEGLFDAIAKRLTIHNSIDKIELASRGGDGRESLKIGRLLRKKNITTTVGGNCNSGCALIFLGGSRRVVSFPYWELGFHRVSRNGIAIWDGDAFYANIKNYINDMIGGGNDLLGRSLLQDGLDFYRPAQRDLCWRNIATNVAGICDVGTESKEAADGAKQNFN